MAVDQERAEKAVEYLISTAGKLGTAKAEAVRAEAMLRHIKALAMRSSDEKSAAAQERDAYASDKYLVAIDDLFAATRDAETLKAEREAAQATIEFWRSSEASRRGAERGFHSAR
jgi:hypothetical protein